MDQDVVDRIRSASFSLARKGYEKREVDRFLDELADWLETGGDDTARSDVVRRELERIGEQTTAILTEAHDAAETMRVGADRQVRQQLADANIKAESLRSAAEEYAEEVREEADAYARRVRSDADALVERARVEADSAVEDTRADADAYAQRTRAEADSTLAEAREKAERSAQQIVDEAQRRRADVEKVIADLEERREAVIGELRRLASAAGIAPSAQEDQASPGPRPATVDGEPRESAADVATEPDEARTRPLPIRGDL